MENTHNLCPFASMENPVCLEGCKAYEDKVISSLFHAIFYSNETGMGNLQRLDSLERTGRLQDARELVLNLLNPYMSREQADELFERSSEEVSEVVRNIGRMFLVQNLMIQHEERARSLCLREQMRM